MKDYIEIKGARENNLKNIDVNIPKNKLVVITGPSGSGKSTLAFDTIYAEGKRRYIESLNSYARQFLGGSEKPDVDVIEGLSPAISIDQKTGSNNPRSTVGTITEIFDYLRLLYARIGEPYCPKHNIKIENKSNETIKEEILLKYINEKIEILAPIIDGEKGTHQKLLDKLLQDGYTKVYIDDILYDLSFDEINLEKNKKHKIYPVMGRFKLKKEDSVDLLIAIENANKLTNGNIIVKLEDNYQKYSTKYSCPQCDFIVPELEPRLFSFNSPFGACSQCNGLGVFKTPDIDLFVPDKTKSLNQGCIQLNGFGVDTYYFRLLKTCCQFYDIDLDKPFNQLTAEEIYIIMYGSDQEFLFTYKSDTTNIQRMMTYEGIINNVNRRYLETSSERARKSIESIMSESVCSACNGARLSQEALAIKINDKNIYEVTNMSIAEGYEFFKNLKLTKVQKEIAKLVLLEIQSRYQFLNNVGLEYLTLSRNATTLSGGEAQRIRLATQVGSKLTGVLYVLDEPSIGLHQHDNDRLINTLKDMRDLGNTLIVVEHDDDTILNADYVIDIGPGSGKYGGEIIAKGTPQEIMKDKKSLTGKFLSQQEIIEVPKNRRKQNNGYITIKKASLNNIKNLSVKIPKNNLVCVTGVSGSGKSTLVNSILYNSVYNQLNSDAKLKEYGLVDGIDDFKKIIRIDQKPIGRTPRSNPATYIGVFDDIRDLYASLPESQARGYLKGRFSFNVKGGRCEECEGDGIIKIEMNFLPDVYVKCEKCQGKRYNPDVLEVKYKGKNISDILEMEIIDAYEFFKNIPVIERKLKTLVDVGLGYLQLGTPATVLSGGEAQRIKLAKELAKTTLGNTLYILDEPTTGLHTSDIKKLVSILQNLVDKNNTMIIIEHNLELIKTADYIIDLGPYGGNRGGKIIANDVPEKIIKNQDSLTAKYLDKYVKSTRFFPLKNKN